AERDRRAQPEQMSGLADREAHRSRAQRAAAERDDAAWSARGGANRVHLALAEPGLALRGEDLRNRFFRGSLDRRVDLDEGHPQGGGEQRRQGGLDGARLVAGPATALHGPARGAGG